MSVAMSQRELNPGLDISIKTTNINLLVALGGKSKAAMILNIKQFFNNVVIKDIQAHYSCIHQDVLFQYI